MNTNTNKHTQKIPIEEENGDTHNSNSLYFPKAQTLPLFSLTTLYLCPTSTITPNPKIPPSPFLFSFKYFSSSTPSIPFTCDGNYEEPTSLVCPG